MAVRYDEKKKRWRIETTIKLPDGNKIRRRPYSPINTRRGAEKYERQVIDYELENYDKPKERQEAVPLFKEFADEFMQTYVKNKNKPSEIASKKSILKNHLIRAFRDKRLDKIGTRDVEHLKSELMRKGKSKKTINNILAVLSKLLSYAIDIEIITKKPKIELNKIPPEEMDFLIFEEYGQLLSVLEEEPTWGSAIIAAGEAGLRVGEILGLYQRDIDFDNEVINVRRSLWCGYLGSPKGNKARKIPMSQLLAKTLRRQVREKAKFVWQRPNGDPMTVNIAEYNIRKTCERARLRKIGWHTLRHTFCSHLAMLGAPVKAIQELAGHVDIQTTMRYMHLAPESLQDAIGLMSGRDLRLEAEVQEQGTNRAPQKHASHNPRNERGKSASPTGIEPVFPA